MGNGNQIPVDVRGVPLDAIPYFIHVEPNAAVAPGNTVTVTLQAPPRNFVWTHIGFTTALVGVPAAAQPFKIGIRDVGDSTLSQNQRFTIQPVVGGSANANSDMFELAHPWTFRGLTTIQVEFENLGTLAALPYLDLHGYQTNYSTR